MPTRGAHREGRLLFKIGVLNYRGATAKALQRWRFQCDNKRGEF